MAIHSRHLTRSRVCHNGKLAQPTYFDMKAFQIGLGMPEIRNEGKLPSATLRTGRHSVRVWDVCNDGKLRQIKDDHGEVPSFLIPTRPQKQSITGP